MTDWSEKRTDSLLNSANTSLKELKDSSKKIVKIQNDLKTNPNQKLVAELFIKKKSRTFGHSRKGFCHECHSRRT